MKKIIIHDAYSPVFAGVSTLTLDCDVSLKCVCESQNHMRLVDCPEEVEYPFEYEYGFLTADCSADVDAMCDELGIKCKKNETPNCLVTLPVEVEI